MFKLFKKAIERDLAPKKIESMQLPITFYFKYSGEPKPKKQKIEIFIKNERRNSI
jgi:hypothetical protein